MERSPEIREVTAVFVARHRELRGIAARIVRQADCLDDVMQDAYVRLVIGARGAEVFNPFGYCCQVVRNTAFDCLRRRMLEAGYVVLTADGELPEVCDERQDLAMIDERRLIEQLEATLASFPSRTRRVFELSRLDGKTQREIGKLVGVSATMVNVTIREVMKALAPLRGG